MAMQTYSKKPKKVSMQKIAAFGQQLPGMLQGAGEVISSFEQLVQQGLFQFNLFVKQLQGSGFGNVFAQAQRDWQKFIAPFKRGK